MLVLAGEKTIERAQPIEPHVWIVCDGNSAAMQQLREALSAVAVAGENKSMWAEMERSSVQWLSPIT